MWKIVNTDNFGGDYPNEKFVENIPPFALKEQAQAIVNIINNSIPENYSRYWKVVEDDYKLQPGFEP